MASYPELLAELEVGQSHGSVERIDGDAALKDVLREWIERKTSTATKAIGRVRDKHPARTFTTENGEFRTRSKDLILAIVVTRTS